MDLEEFKKQGHAMVDWMVEYYRDIGKYPVKSQVKPGYLKKLIPDSPPQKGENWEEIMEDMKKFIMPGITHWQHNRFFAYFPANTSYPGILGEMVCSTLSPICFSWVCSPAATELETIMMANVMELPEDFKSSGSGGGIIQGSASDACLCAILAARARVFKEKRGEEKELSDKQKGEIGSKLVAYVSDQTHSSVQKGCQIAGISRICIIKSNSKFEIDTDELEKTIKYDLEKGFIPFFVCATIGTTSSASNDDLQKVGAIAKEHNLWGHIDAAYAGSFLILPEFREKFFKGIEFFSSFNYNPHKMMLTNFDCSLMWVNKRDDLIDALSITPEYLRSKEYEKKLVFDYRDWQVPLGRRFRSLKLWFVLRNYGVEGLQKFVRKQVEFGKMFEKWIVEDDDFELAAERHYSLICFRLKGSNEANKLLEEKLNSSGKIFLVHTQLNKNYVLRMAIGGRLTTKEDLVESFKLIKETAQEFKGK